ncbi:pyridoxal phosphate-dependent aminotransferase [Roseobacter sp. S98]|uniref:pyridoxal phosphate-dependent aminotransferase n=1 Tax=Roseobacter algicola (ex Choi et al. 2025) (nom. illeg.) TaxID=3092138 RepID=UPI0035C780B4
MIQPLDHIAAMSPYALAETGEAAVRDPVHMAQNESLRPPSPAALDAAKKALHAGALYPDPDWTELRTALASQHGIPAQNILCGNGSLDLIAALARAYAGPGRAILAPQNAYPFFATAARMAGARFDVAPEKREGVCVGTLLRCVRPDTSVVFVANPGNPTGTEIPVKDLQALRAGLPDDVLLVIDGAYAEFSEQENADCWDFVETGNCAVLRTFSKAYGLAGFRVGWGLFPTHIAQQVRKVLNPNNLSSAAQSAAAGAVRDQAYLQETCHLTARARVSWSGQLMDAGFNVTPGCTNFIGLWFPAPDAAEDADRYLRSAGVFLRRQQGAGLPQLLRWTLAPDDMMQRGFDALLDWQRKQRS